MKGFGKLSVDGVVDGAALLYIAKLVHLLQLLLFAFSLDMDGRCWEDLNLCTITICVQGCFDTGSLDSHPVNLLK